MTREGSGALLTLFSLKLLQQINPPVSSKKEAYRGNNRTVPVTKRCAHEDDEKQVPLIFFTKSRRVLLINNMSRLSAHSPYAQVSYP